MESVSSQLTATNTGATPQTLGGLIGTFKKNFLTKEVSVAEGLTFNQYDILKRVYYYLHNQFESGMTDSQNNPKHFYDLHTHRNSQVTKNIRVQTKDAYIKSETPNSYYKSYLLRREFIYWAKEYGYGPKLAQLAENLPHFGTIVWKKVKDVDGQTCVTDVDLLNLINDPVVECLKDGLVVERHLVTQSEMKEKTVWNQTEVEALIRSGKRVSNVNFMTSTGIKPQDNAVDETTPYYEVFELWGEIPKWMYDKYKASQDAGPGTEAGPAQVVQGDKANNETVYVMAFVSGVEGGDTERVLYINEADRDEFPYEEVHLRRMKGRWLGFGNIEALFGLTERANELTNTFYQSLRLGSRHLYQTRDRNYVKNVLTDLEDGDVVVSKSEIAPIATELRAFSQYQAELKAIEQQADRICNSFEIVTGENLPSGTPFRLGAQQLSSANKFFEDVRGEVEMFLERIFNNWLLPDFAKNLTEEHVLELIDDTDDIDVYYDARKKIFQYEALKQYILNNNEMPSGDQLNLVGQLSKDSIAKGAKQITVLKAYYSNLKYSIKFVTSENDATKRNVETLTTSFQALAANPAALQDERLLKIFNMILESTGYSPLQINTVNQKQPNPSLNPANQGGNGVQALQEAQAAAGGAQGGAA